MSRLSLTLTILVALTASVAITPPEANADKHALLVGCTVYPNLNEKFNLIGPANDVELARKMLVDRFEFPEENIRVLADHLEDESLQPTRENVEKGWADIAAKAKKGDQVFILMAGHGTQAPLLEEDESEADGLDELFLPKDIGKWDDSVGSVARGIKDDDIKNWIAAIQGKGANLWVIIDACHSGTMTRDLGDEVKRELRPDALGVPQEVADTIRERQSHGTTKKETQLIQGGTRALGNDEATDEPVLIALYAAQSIEPTVEKRLPTRGDDRKYYGLLTYTMNQIMAQSESKMTYRELVQKIHKQYIKWGRTSPTPVLEGNGLDREVLGLERLPDRPSIHLSGSRFRGYTIDVGSLAGLTVGSILAVYPEAGAADADKPIGHVQIIEKGFEALRAGVKPIEYGGLPAPSVKSGMRCKTVFVDFGDNRLRVCVAHVTDKEEPVPNDDRLLVESQVDVYAASHSHLVEKVNNPGDADWLLTYDSLDSHKMFLTPVSGWSGEQEGELPPLYGPAPEGEKFLEWLGGSLDKMGRVKMLLSVSGGASDWDADPSIDLEVRLFKGRRDRQGSVVKYDSNGMKLYNGDRIGFKVKNNSESPMDVTMLMIDSSYGIYPLYPAEGQVNRLYPGNQIVRTGSINAKTTGLEHVLVIATKARPVDEPTNFAFLAQASIERSRALGGKAMSSPLGQVFQNSLFGEGGTRGASSSDVASYIVKTVSWQTMPKERPE